MSDFDDFNTAETPKEYYTRHEYQRLTPRELKSLLQEKHNNGSLTLVDAQVLKALFPDPKKLISVLPEKGDDWSELIPKSIVSGALAVSDTPKILEIPYNLQHGEDHPSARKAKDTLKKFDPHTYGDFDQESLLDSLKNKVRPKPDTPGKRIAANAAEFVGAGVNPVAVAKATLKNARGIYNIMEAGRAAKEAAKLGGIGATSGVLQEYGDMNPLAADIVASATVPLALRGGRLATQGTARGISHFLKTPEQKLDYKVAKELRKHVPETDIPKVLENLKEGVPIINPTFAEAAVHPGISNLDRLLGRNTPGTRERYAANNELIKEELARLGKLEVDPEDVGGVITNSLHNDFKNLKQKRFEATNPLLEDLKKYEEKVDVSDVVSYLTEQAKHEKGEIKAAYLGAKKLLMDNHHNPNSIFRKLDKDKNNPIPFELRTTAKALNARIQKAKSPQVKAALMDAKEAIEAKALASPGGLEYQRKYAEMSEPISDIFGNETKPNLLGNIIKRDQFDTRFELPPEKVMPKVFGASKEDQRKFLSQVKNNPEALQAAKDGVVNHFFQKMEQGGLDAHGRPKMSNIKANKWLEQNNNITSNLFDPKEHERLDNIGKAMTRRQMVADVSSAPQSDTYANFSLGNEIGKVAVDELAHAIPGGATTMNIVRNLNNTPAKIQSKLQKTLLDIPYGESLLRTHVKDPLLKDATKSMYSWTIPRAVANRDYERRKPVAPGDVERRLRRMYREE